MIRNLFRGHTRAVIGVGVAVLAVIVATTVYFAGDPPLTSSNAQSNDVAPGQVDGEDSALSQIGASASAAASASASASAGASGSARPPTPRATPGNGVYCARKPSACGYPDETNTGWRHTGVTLKAPPNCPGNLEDARGCMMNGTFYVGRNAPGTVVDGMDINACVYVRALNVTIKRSRIRCSAQPMVKNFEPTNGRLVSIGAGLLLQDVEFDGKGSHTAHGVAFNDYTVRRGYFHDLGAAAKLGTNMAVYDSFVHKFADGEGAHVGGFPSDGGRGIKVIHNTVLMNNNKGYPVAIYNGVPVGSVVADVVLDNNLLAGGNYILYCGAPGNIAPNLQVKNNRFSKALYPKGGNYGPSANCRGAAVWDNNYWDEDRSPYNP